MLLDQGEQAPGPRWQAHSQSFHSLDEALKATTEPALVVLGPPGSGKSTLLRHYELDCARSALADAAADPPLTFFISLNDYRPARPGEPPPDPKDWLVARWQALDSELPALFTQRPTVLLLDALNEIPVRHAEAIPRWKAFLRELEAWPKVRAVFSCRSLDYSASLSSKELPVPQVRLEALSNAQVEQFVMRHSPEHGEALWRNLQHSRQLDLLRLPYYLKLLVEQTHTGEIPTGRAALFTNFVRQALQREIAGDNIQFRPGALLHPRDVRRLQQANVWKTPTELPERGCLIPKLSELAFEMQYRSPTDTAQVRVDYDTATTLLGHDQADSILDAGAALGVLEQDLGRDEVLFVHQLMQEYFAARRLASQPDPLLVQQAWRVDQASPSLDDALAEITDADPLPPLPATGWEETTLLASAMTEHPENFIHELSPAQLPLAGRCAAQPDVVVSATCKNKIRHALMTRSQAAEADLRARIAAGLALGELGDPRFARRSGPDSDYLLPPLVAIPGGRYTLGSDDDEQPRHEINLIPFWIGQFPVTNAEWALFIAAGGYDDERWWQTPQARDWQQGNNTAEGPKQQWREDRRSLQNQRDAISRWHQEGRITSKQAEDWQSIVDMDDDAYEQWLDVQLPGGRHTQPRFWNDDAFNNPAQPVVGICWYEAQAYCRWLSAQSGQTLSLPSEAQWEAAARGPAGRRYAYGNRFDPSRGNTFESHIRRTTPVGIFPAGATPEGVTDMTGNTWDWTSSLHQPYPYNAEDGREKQEEEGPRVVRGGSWFDDQIDARAAVRFRNRPAIRNLNLGLRVVSVSLIES